MEASNFLFFAVYVIGIVFVMTEMTTFLKSFIFAFSCPSDIRLDTVKRAGLEVIEARKVPRDQRRNFSERRWLGFMGYFENSIIFHAMMYDEAHRKFSIVPALAVASVSAIGFACSPLFSVDALCESFLAGVVVFATGSLKGYLAQKEESEAFEKRCTEVFKAAKANA